MADEIKKDSAENTQPATATNDKKAEKVKKVEKPAKTDKAAKTAKSASKEKKPNVFVRMGKGIKRFFKELKSECKKIVWPEAKTVLKSSLVVIVSVVIIGAVIWLIDTGLSELVKLLVNLAAKVGENGSEATTTAGAIITNFFGV